MFRRTPGRLVIFIVGALALSGSCGHRQGDNRINVLFIIVDTLRGDHLGCYGYERARTPNIDYLASRGARFDRVVTAAPVTAPSVASLLTSTFPNFHGVRDNELFSLNESLPNLATVCREAGYSTGGFVGSIVLHRRHGFGVGFDHYDDDMSAEYVCYDESYAPQSDELQGTQRRADDVTEAALEWLSAHGRDDPFMCAVHYFDPHDPYDPPPDARAGLGDAPYDVEISFTDSQIGVLLKGMEDLGLEREALVVFTADHGEGLGEHLERTHGFFLYDSTILVPLIIYLPEVVPSGVVFSSQVRTVDIMPTILDLAGLSAPKTVQGMSLAPALLTSEKLQDREAYIETYHTLYSYRWHELLGVRTPQWKYVGAPRPELYNLQIDPHELKNLADIEPEIAAGMDASLTRLEREFFSGSAGYAASRPEYDPEMIEKMKALGYLGGAQRRGAKLPEPGGDFPDPKSEMIKLNARQEAGGHLRVAATLMLAGNFDAALERVAAAERVAPDYAEVQASRGLILVQKGELDEGVRLLERAVETDPRAQMIHQTLNNLGLAYLQQGRCDEAIDTIEKSLRLKQDYQNALYNLGLANETCGNADEAVRAYEAFIECSPGIDPSTLQSLRRRIEALESSASN